MSSPDLERTKETSTPTRSNTLDNKSKINMGVLLRRQYMKAQSELEEQEEKLNELINNNSKMKKRIKKYKEKIDILERELENEKMLKQLHSEQYEEVEELLREMKSNMASKEIEWERVKIEKDSLKEKIERTENLSNKNKILRQQIREKDEHISQLRQEKVELEKQLQEVEVQKSNFEENQELSRKIRLLNEEIETQTQEINTLRSEKERYEIQRNIDSQNLRKQNLQLQEKLNVETFEREKIKSEYEKINPKKLKEAMTAVKTKVKGLRESYYLVSQIGGELQDLNNDVKIQITQISSKVNQNQVEWNNKHQKLQTNFDEKIDQDAQQKIKQLEEENKKLKEELSSLELRYSQSIERSKRFSPSIKKQKETIVVPEKRKKPAISVNTTLFEEILRAEKSPLLTDEGFSDEVHELWRICKPTCDPLVCCSLERGIVEDGGSCEFCAKIFIYILLFPTILIPPLFIYLSSYVAYYYKFDKCCGFKDTCLRVLSHEKILFSGLLTSCLYIPGLVYAFVHFILLVSSHFCCFRTCCYEKNLRKTNKSIYDRV